MLSKNESVHYLNAIGIDVWVPREVVGGNTSPASFGEGNITMLDVKIEAYPLRNAEQQIVAYAIIDSHELQQENAKELLTKILGALTFKADTTMIQLNPSQLIEKYKPCIALGHAAFREGMEAVKKSLPVHFQASFLITYGLSDMLADPSLKRDVWNGLKVWLHKEKNDA